MTQILRRSLRLALMVVAPILALALALASAGAGRAQDAAQPPPPIATAPSETPPAPPPPAQTAPRPPGVEVTTLAAPDAFTTPGRDTGLPATLWRGASAKTVKAVLPLLATKTLSPAGAALARRVLATGAPGPAGIGDDPGVVAARAEALLVQGDPRAAAAILSRAPGIDRNADLAHAAAESALLAGDDARACTVAQGLGSGRDDVYWLRLRTYCQALAGHTDQAQLTFDLAQTQARDPVFGRLMSAKISGVGNPGAASLRNGLDLALSRSLGLDVDAGKPAPEVAAALSKGDPEPPTFDPAAFGPDIAPAVQQIVDGKPVTYGAFMSVMNGIANTPKAPNRAASAALLIMALGDLSAANASDQLEDWAVPEGRAPVGRNIALDAAADRKLAGEAALLALWACADAGPAGPAIGDRIRIVRALHLVGLEPEARAFALEGLLSLK
ncbi:hypothetical protein [Phenylobacterium sp.]|uniref:hypothetical protein n=1 Tax=Phenylobacterium sp. TaxID=1871053 RepID=UPI002F3E6AB4